MIRLDIFSDPGLPLVLHRQGQPGPRAGRTIRCHPFAIQWHPFQLNPDMPPEGMPTSAPILRQSSAVRPGVDAIHDRLREAARAAGCRWTPMFRNGCRTP
jgi:hypothetical protein